MKVTCTQEALARGLGIVGRAVAARSPLPITSNVLLATDKDRLKLTATNLEITMSCWIQASTEDSRPVLTGVHTNFEGKLLKLAASDGFRLSVFELPLENPVEEKTEIVVPARALAELNRLLADEEEPITLETNAGKTQVLFRL